MFRFIKKWYFKMYHLFRFLGVLIIILGLNKNVYAEEVNECYQNYILGNITKETIGGTGNENLYRIRPSLYPVNSTTEVYVKFFPKDNNFDESMIAQTIMVWNSNIQTICQDNNILENRCTYTNFTYDKKHHIISFKYKGDVGNNAYFGIKIYRSYTNSIASIEGTPLAFTQNLNNFLACEPQEEETTNTALSDFISLYINKITYLANGFISNQYLFSMFVVILAFIILELFLKVLHLKGGKK